MGTVGTPAPRRPDPGPEAWGPALSGREGGAGVRGGEGRLFTREGSFRDARSVLAGGEKGEGEACAGAADWLRGAGQ